MVRHRNFLISDEAWSNLRIQAVNYGYMSPHINNYHGLGAYASALADCVIFEDARTWKDTDMSELEEGRFPFWFEIDTFMANRKVLVLTHESISKLSDIAKRYGIIRQNNLRYTPIALASNTLEAVGLDLLIPLDMLPCGKYHRKGKTYVPRAIY
jgi:hypothetical protein